MIVRDGTARSLALLAIAAGLGFTVLLAVFPITSFDVWWHLKTGEIILRNGRIPTTDSFTYTAFGRPWITHEWLSEVIFYLLHRAGGVDALIVFKSILAALAIGLSAVAGVIGADWRRRLPAAAVGIVLAAPLISPRAFVRPHMMTALLLGATLLLLRLESETGKRRWRWTLIPLFVIWANLHSGFLLGLGLVVIYWVGERPTFPGGTSSESPPAWGDRGLVLAAALAATLINPHHAQALLYPIKLVLRPEVRGTIVELRSIFHPAYRGALFLDALFATAVVTVILLVISRRQICWAVLLPGLVFLLLALRSLRNVSELAVLVPALVAVHGSALGRKPVVAAVVSVAVMVAATVEGGMIARSGTPMGADGHRRIGLGVDTANCPVAAVEFLRQEHPSGRIFNPLAFGGYLIHELWPRNRVFVDGRLDVFEPEFLVRYQRLIDLGEGWDEAVSEYGIALAIIDYQADLSVDWNLRARLRDDPDWVCVFFSDNALVYARRIPENHDLLARFACPFDPSRRTDGSARAFAVAASTAELDQSIAAVEKMLEIAPDQETPAIVAGKLLAFAGRAADAVEWLTRVLERQPANVDAALLLADVERGRGRPDAALEALQRAAAVAPGSYLVQLRLGVLNAQLGRFDQAERHLIRALEIRPGDPAAQQNLSRLRDLRHP